MVCKICGKQLPDGSSVCKYCGAKQRKPDPAARPTPSHRYSKKGLARRRMINTVLIGIIALLIVGVIAGIAASTRSAGEEHKEQLSADQANQEAQTDKKDNESDDKADTPDESKKDDKTEKPDESKKDDKTEKPDESKKDDKADQEDKKPNESDKDTAQPDDTADSEQSGLIGEESSVDESEEPTDDESEESDEPTGETQTPVQPQVPTAPTGNYTASINRTAVVASLNHYRILTVSINQSLPTGVEVESISFTSSDSSIVRTEVVDGEGRAWGVRLGKATVTGTVTLNTGETASASCEVTVEEYKEPEPPAVSGSGSTGSTGSTGSSGNSGSSGSSGGSGSSGNSGSTGSSDYILSGSNSRVYSVSELSKLSDSQLRLARNEIYARHGRIFNDPALQRYFEGKSWYKGTVAPDKFDVSVLNAVEEQNIENIQKAEAN